jgi:hypothetical protein
MVISSNQTMHTHSSNQATHTLSSNPATHTLSSNPATRTLSSSLAIRTLQLEGHIKTQVLLISLFPHFRIQGLILGQQVIQPLTTILVIIRQLEVTQVVDTVIRLPCGMIPITQIIHLSSIQPMLQTQQVLIVLVLQPQRQWTTSSITSNGLIITVKQKLVALQGQNTCLLLAHLTWEVQCLVCILLPTPNLPRLSPRHLGGLNLHHLNCHLCRYSMLELVRANCYHEDIHACSCSYFPHTSIINSWLALHFDLFLCLISFLLLNCNLRSCPVGGWGGLEINDHGLDWRISGRVSI